MSEYFTVFDSQGNPIFRPTIYYAYHPTDFSIASMHDFLGRELSMKDKKIVVKSELIGGIDELGVLLLGDGIGKINKGQTGLWYGSQMSVEESFAIQPGEGPTTMQVVANMLAGIVWMIQNPNRGYVEPEELPFDFILNIARPFLGTMTSTTTNWSPIKHRNSLYKVELDTRHPWRFENFRVID